MALTKGRCWDNHVTLQNGQSQPNNRSANINSIFKIHRGNYTDKYCMSTLLTVYSYYGLPLPKSDIGKMLLLCVDSGYLGHYNDFFKSVHNSYIEQLELNPLLDVLNKYGKKDFEDLKKRYKTDGKIKLNRNRILETDINLVEMQGFFDVELSLPKQKFYGHTKMKRNSGYIDQTKPVGEVFSFALTGKNYASYTVKEKV
ncbi:hypothetical protein [Guptibacillus hwajinpoensis]|uniref:hypothetical protein n=1 Tax=Guptibacillus hwajinpoensis TaxID=208199 RepID=UPI003735F43E